MSVDTGLRVVEVGQDQVFLGRVIHTRDTAEHMESVQRIARVFVESPERILQELVDAAVILWGFFAAPYNGSPSTAFLASSSVISSLAAEIRSARLAASTGVASRM
jgi:hypothetical protein